jgi:WD40 repeat protein
LNTGKVSNTLPLRSDWNGYDIAFSPNGRRLAYSLKNPVILDLKTGETISIDTGRDAVGDLTWSPDGKKLAYSTCRPNADSSAVAVSKIQIYALDAKTAQTIFEVKNVMTWIENENDPTRLKIGKDDLETQKWAYSFFDWATEKWMTATPEP